MVGQGAAEGKAGNLHQIKSEMERHIFILRGGDGAVNMYSAEPVCGQQDGTVVSCSVQQWCL